MKLTDLAGIIFDLDGTLIDSAHVWTDIDKLFLRKRGITMPDDYSKMVSTMNFTDAAVYTKKRFGIEESISAIMNEWFEYALYEYSYNIKARPNVRMFLEALREAGVRLAVATASNIRLYTAVLKNNGIYDLFEAFASTEEVTRGKGFPDVYELAARRLRLAPDRCAVIEDLVEGVHGAAQGGFMTIACINGVFPEDEQKLRAEADLAFSDYKELMALL